jgi:uncharacterized RDD family membrane protein YckC
LTVNGHPAVNPSPTVPAPGLPRRLAAGFYDLVVLAALWWLAALPFILLAGGVPSSGAARFAFQLYLLAVMFLFYGGFWVHGGQTLGMRAWRLRVTRSGGGPIGWHTAAWRFFLAWLSVLCLGLGFGWALIDRERRTWHDILSGTRLVLLPREAGSSRSTGDPLQQEKR